VAAWTPARDGCGGCTRSLTMARFHSLRVYQLARAVLRDCIPLTANMPGYSDLANQMRRAAVSVISNIGEGAATGTQRHFVHYLTLARASANELQAQLDIACDLGFLDPAHPVLDRCDHLGRSLTRFILVRSG
jgi:four helix bundle protein